MLPLCVDLDGTLVRTDTLYEQIVRLVLDRPLTLLMLPLLWLAAGRARLKRRLDEVCPLDPETLPYQVDFVEFLREQRGRGRHIVLATAADSGIARGVATHLGLFDEVYASDGERNLKGTQKADALVEIFGERGFVYAGDSPADIAVWKRAAAAVFVNSSRRTREHVESWLPVEGTFGGRIGRFKGLIRAMRIYQWVKNILCFVAMFLAHKFSSQLVAASFMMFAAFCCAASGVYMLNDLADLESDRAHPRKRRRPFASGDLPLTWGVIGPLLVVVGLAIAACVNSASLGILVVYIVTTSAYSFKLKTFPLVDVFVLAGLYTIRLYSGGVATGIDLSIWLLGFSTFLFLSLAFLKRCGEIASAEQAGGAQNTRRGYQGSDNLVLQMMGVSSAFMASLVLSLYVDTDVAKGLYRLPVALWFAVPLHLFWQCRMWLSAARGTMTDDPIVYATKDWVTWLVALVAGCIFTSATFGIPGM